MTQLLFIALIGCLLWVLWLRRRAKALELHVEEKDREKQAAIQLLDRIGESLTLQLEIEPALQIIVEYTVEATGAEAGAIFLMDPTQSYLTARVVQGLFPPMHGALPYALAKRKFLVDKVKAERIPLGEGVIGGVAREGSAALITDCQDDPRVPQAARDFIAMNSMMAAPLHTRGATLGVIAVVNKRQGQVFSEQDMSLLQALADQAAVTVDLVGLVDEVAEKRRIEQELRLAHEFQKMLLPKRCPDVEGFDLAAFSSPALEVGGDFYDFLPFDDGSLGIVIADVSGKGTPAALVMAMARSALRAEARGCASPRETLRRLNERLIEDTKENVFITMTYGILDPRRGVFRFARAGHEPVLLCSGEGEEPRQRAPNGIALGMVEPETFDLIQEDEITLAAGETALLYTDGAVEARNKAGEEFGHTRLFDSVRRLAHGSSEEMVRGLLGAVQSFCKDAPQHDDITLVVVRAKRAAEEPSVEAEDRKRLTA